MRLPASAFSAVILATGLAALTACGGGTGESAVEQKSQVDAYVGTWAVCVKSKDPGRSWREQYTIKKLSATTGEFDARVLDFTNEECRGEPESWNANRDTIEWTGETQEVDGITAQRVLIKSGTTFSNDAPTEVAAVPATTEHQVVAVVNGSQLRIGTFTESNLQSYPQHFWSEILLRQ